MRKLRRTNKSKKEVRIPGWVNDRTALLANKLKKCTDPSERRIIRQTLDELLKPFQFPARHLKPRGIKKTFQSKQPVRGGWINWVQGGAPGSGKNA